MSLSILKSDFSFDFLKYSYTSFGSIGDRNRRGHRKFKDFLRCFFIFSMFKSND